MAETILGEALRGRRDRAHITTKVGNPVGSGQDGGHPAGADYAGTGLGPEHVEQQIDASLRRLRTDYVDYYLLHIADADTPLEDTLGALDRLVRAGKVRHWGFSNFDAAQIEAMLDLCRAGVAPPPVMAQPCYNWLERDVESGYLPACRRAGIGITPYRPLAGGLLSGKYRPGGTPPAGSRASESAWIDAAAIPYERLRPFDEEAAAGRRPTGLPCGPLAARARRGRVGGDRREIDLSARGAGGVRAGAGGMTAGAAGGAVDQDRLTATAMSLMEVPSPTGEAGAAADRLAELLAADGFMVERMAAGHPDAPAVIARLAGERPGPTLQFDGHLDTVHLPYRPPRLEGGVLAGTGAADMKAGIAAAVEALRAVRDAGGLPAGGLLLTAHDLHEAPWAYGEQLDAMIAAGVAGDAVMLPEYEGAGAAGGRPAATR